MGQALAVAAGAKLLQSCPTLLRPHRRQPTRLPSLGFSRQEHQSGLSLPSPMHGSEREVTQLCPTLHDPMDCSLPGSSIHGIFQARVLEWGAVAFSLINASCYYYFRHLNILLLKAEEFSKAAFNQPFVLVDIGFLPLIKSFVSE